MSIAPQVKERFRFILLQNWPVASVLLSQRSASWLIVTDMPRKGIAIFRVTRKLFFQSQV